MSANETVTTYQLGGKTYEIDHAGAAVGVQWDEFAVYCGNEQVAEFAVADCPPDSLPPEAELIRLARKAVALNEAHDLV